MDQAEPEDSNGAGPHHQCRGDTDIRRLVRLPADGLPEVHNNFQNQPISQTSCMGLHQLLQC